MSDAVTALDEHFVGAVRAYDAALHAKSDAAEELLALFRAQATSRHLDFAARWMQTQGAGFYTISSAGHEANAAVSLLSEVTDPALLHYRSGAFYIARANKAGRATGARDVLLGVSAAEADPISGGRHKVIGNRELHVIPQTSTIASHLPRAVGLGFALGLARDLAMETDWSDDSVVLCSFGDASANHSTAIGAINAAAYLTHRGIACPTLFVCEDNGIGISTPSPAGWTSRQLSSVPGIRYFVVDGSDSTTLLDITRAALRHVRSTRSPAVLHVKTVRFLGHAGSDVESAYRLPSAIAADYERDPLLGTAYALIDAGIFSAEEVIAEYRAIGAKVMAEAAAVVAEPRLTTREAVVAPLEYPLRADASSRQALRPAQSPTPGALTFAQAINAALAAVLDEHPNALIFGEDVGRKGGVYGVTRGLQKRFGRRRVFDTLLDEQTILGTALGSALAGFLPIPEIQYLAYLHNAEDQLRGEAASLAFFSNRQYTNGMVVRIAGLAYQKGFGGHFHNDNSLAVLRDIPGIVIAVPSNPSDAAGMLRTCVDLANDHGRVCAFVEPIALYHARDLQPGDGKWLAAVDPTERVPLGEIAVHGEGEDLLIVTFGNGVPMSLRAVDELATDGISARVVDLRWLLPLPTEPLLRQAQRAQHILIVDETRASASLGDAVRASIAAANPEARIDVVTAADSFIPLGSASGAVLVQEQEIIARGKALVGHG